MAELGNSTGYTQRMQLSSYLHSKILKIWSPIIFVLIFNLWLIKIFSFNQFIGVIAVLASLTIYISCQLGKAIGFYISLFFMIFLMYFQYKTTTINSLISLNENERILQIERMRGYPRNLYRFANWLEQRKEIIAYYKIEDNFFESINPNKYFFANHPRERAGIVEYEKFPYAYLPFFILGILSARKKYLKILLLSLSPLVLLSIIGTNNHLDEFSMFPAIAVYSAMGLRPVFENKKYLFGFILIFIPLFIQIISYATN